MNEKAKEIIDVAREFVKVAKKAELYGVIGSVADGRIQIFGEKEFKKVALESPQMPRLFTGEGQDYPYRYSVEVEELTFIHLSHAPIYPADEVEEK